jgi:hypothetical protein
MIARTLCAAIAAAAFASAAGAQQFSLGANAAGGTYQEQGSSLAFTGWGPGLAGTAAWKRYAIWLDVYRISYSPTSSSTGAEPFDLTQFDGRARYSIDSTWTLEAGYKQQTIAPSDAAQGMSAIPLGGRVNFALAPGARITAFADYLAAAKFSGGGSAPFAMEVGMSAFYAPNAGSLRFTVGYAFDRIDRQTTSSSGTIQVPIQSSVVQLGVALEF